jgi:hypothetical protein
MSNVANSIDPMIVRMARAIALSQGSSVWENYVVAARASLNAIREPSDEMLEAASNGMPDWGELPQEWRSMIDYVIGEGALGNDNHPLQKPTRDAG